MTSLSTLWEKGKFATLLNLDDQLEDGTFFIDRDSTHFRLILNFCRDGHVTLPKDPQILSEISIEAAHFGLMRLVDDAHLQLETVHSEIREMEKTLNLLSEVTPVNNEDENSSTIHCYMCHKPVNSPLPLCQECQAFNLEKRQDTVDMTGLTALVTGGRIKIGYFSALKLLRSGATVAVTSRFPANTLSRFQVEDDFDNWRDRLFVFAVDLRHLPSIEAFILEFSTKFQHLDILINNAAQTIRRPPAFYRHLLPGEMVAEKEVQSHGNFNLESSMQGMNLTLFNLQKSIVQVEDRVPLATRLALTPLLGEDIIQDEMIFPMGQTDENGEQMDLRDANTWLTSIEDVSPAEVMEVMMVNAIAPFLLISKLKKMMSHPSRKTFKKFIVNVSSAEGQFSGFKSFAHCHTNMAKASLNMLTRTSALEFSKQNIFLNSVDPGWASELAPWKLQNPNRKVPLTSEDGAARVLDPILIGMRDVIPPIGIFFRNFKSAPW